jgi:hypothetical protein
MNPWIPLLWLTAALTLLLVAERWIHRHLQGAMLLLTGDPEMALVLYALPLMPGIILHEISHAVAAILLGVRVGRISIQPKLAGQRVQLGFVPVEKTDAVRASLIGLAPLLVGSSVTLLVGYLVFDIGAVGTALVAGDWASVLAGLAGMLKAPGIWIWAYAVFAVSNTMLPSRADRQAWLPVILFLALAVALVWVAGLGPAVISSLSKPLAVALHWLATMCTLTLIADLPFALTITLAEKLLERVRGCKVEYQE